MYTKLQTLVIGVYKFRVCAGKRVETRVIRVHELIFRFWLK